MTCCLVWKNWLGWQDSNLRIAGSEPAALPTWLSPQWGLGASHRHIGESNHGGYCSGCRCVCGAILEICCLCLVGVAGLEPAHRGIKTRCLTSLATPHWFKIYTERRGHNSFFSGSITGLIDTVPVADDWECRSLPELPHPCHLLPVAAMNFSVEPSRWLFSGVLQCAEQRRVVAGAYRPSAPACGYCVGELMRRVGTFAMGK